MNDVLGLLIALSSLAATAYCAEYCTTDGGTYLEYCRFDCCGTWPDQNCCDVYPWIIAVGAIGGVIFISCVVGVICCCVQQGQRPGRVVQPATAATTITTVAYPTPGTQPYYGFQQQQQAQPGQAQFYNQPPPPQQPIYPMPKGPAYPPSMTHQPPADQPAASSSTPSPGSHNKK